MATYVNDLRLKEIATGDESGTWGTSTNTNLELIAEAFSFGTEAITTNADTHATTIADGSTDPGRSIYLKYTGTLDSACTITIGPNTVSKLWFIENGTSGSQNIIISQGSGANVTIPAGHVKAVYSDGAGSGAAIVDAFTNLNLGGTTTVDDLTISDDLTVTDDMTIGGTLGVTGIVTLTDDLIIGDGKTIGSASDVDAMTIASNGQVTFSQTLIGTALDISGDIDVDGTTNLDVVDIDGAVDMASTLAVGGVVTANAGVVVDNITIDGTEIDLSSGDLTIDVAGDIILDADGEDIILKDGGTEFGLLSADSTDFTIMSRASDRDLIFKGKDGGSTITALTLDMSAAGAATFNDAITLKNTLSISSASTSAFLQASTNVLQFGTSSDDPVVFFENNAEKMRLTSGNILVGKTSGTSGNKIETDGRISAGAGSSGQPTFNCEGDTNTGINLPESDRIQLVTGGTEAIRIDSSQRVGIATSSPGQRLDVDGNITASAFIGRSNSSAPTGDASVFRAADNTLAFATASTERMRIDSNGVLQLTTSSASGFVNANGTALELDVNRNPETGAFGDANKSHARILISGLDGGSHIQFNTASANNTTSSERMRIASNGSIGINQSSPSSTYVLDVGGAVRSTGNAPSFNLREDDSSNQHWQLGSYSGVYAIRDVTAGTFPFNINSSGNVGIGTSSPARNLSVDSGSSSGYIQLVNTNSGNGSSDGLQIKLDSAGAEADIINRENGRLAFHTNNTERLRIHTGGQVTIGTTSTSIDSSNFGILLNGSNGRIKSAIDIGATSNVAQFFGNAGEFRIKGDGDAENTNNSYGALSDARLKENIVDATNKLDDINKVQVRNYNLIGSEDKQIGVVAQELESVFPSLVKTNDEGIKSVKYSVFVPILIKAVQEQQEQIESLKSEIANLKGE